MKLAGMALGTAAPIAAASGFGSLGTVGAALGVAGLASSGGRGSGSSTSSSGGGGPLDTTAPALTVNQSDANLAGDGWINSAERTAGVTLTGQTEAGCSVTVATGTGTPVTLTALQTVRGPSP